MLVNKINNTSFRGYRHVINNAGEHLYSNYYPYDETGQKVKIEFYRAGANLGDSPVSTIELDKTGYINFDDIPELRGSDVIPYRIYVNGKHVVDSGLYTSDRASGSGFNLIYRNSTYPIHQGQAISTMIDIHRPGAYYRDFNSSRTGSIDYDVQRQAASEKIIRTVSNMGGGTLAGLEYDVDELGNFSDIVGSTPIWGYDNRTSHHYCAKNDNQIADSVGNINNYETLMRKLFKNDMTFVDDFAITSYGIESLPAQYTLRWANQNPQTFYWFKMWELKNGPLSFGVFKNKENLRFRVVNPDVIYNPKTKKIESNPDYNPRKETYFQVYDNSLVTKEQLANNKELIKNYENTYSENKLRINNSEDTIVNYAFEIKPQEYRSRLEEFIKMNKDSKAPIELDSPEGAIFIGQFTNFKIGTDAEGAVFWDANKDLPKRNYYISGYDEKLLNSIPNISERDYVRELMKRGNYEVQDIAIQAGKYRAQFVKDVQTLYAAQMIKRASTKEEIDKLINNGLPKQAALSSEEIENIIGGWYNLSLKGVESKTDVTLKALMELPLDSLELGDNTVGVLMTSFFSKRASSEDTIGLSRYEFYKQHGGVYAPYHSTYYLVDNLYETKLKDFAYEVISKVNKLSQEKLLDKSGNYTEYGEYVVGLLGKDIAKYAFLKAFAGDKLQAKMMPDDVLKGKITYNYPELRKATTLKALGINATGPEDEAKALARIMSEGLGNLKRKDVDFVAESILKQIEGTNLNSFRLAEAMTSKAGLGLGFRLDAAKDIADMDAVRNGDMSLDEAIDQSIDFWKKYVKEIKKINPNAYLYAEITDLDLLLKSIYGQDADVWNGDLSAAGGKYKNVPDILQTFFRETGIVSEAGYSYTFTDLLRVFSADGEYGNINNNAMKSLKERMEFLINTNNIDYIRNLWTFADNQDKPSVLHVMALDMELFHTNDLTADLKDSKENFEKTYYEIKRRNSRISVMQELTNSDKFEDLPLEAMMNIDNGEYFKTASTRAAAMSKLIRSAINDRLPNTFDKKELLKQALVDLTNGNYLNGGPNVDLQTITVPALQTLEAALDEILSKSGLNLSDSVKKSIIEKAKQRERVEKYAIRGDFDWNGGKHWAAVELQQRAKSVLGNSEFDFMKYSPYTVSVSALLLDSYKEVCGDKNTESFINGTREFVHKYKRDVVEGSRKPLPYTSDSSTVIRQKAYAARDIETVIEMVIQQAEMKSGKKFSKYDRDYIMREVFQSATAPAVQKALMYAAFLSALPGIPAEFYRDMLGGLGYDEKAKNIFLQNRNTVKYSQIEQDGPLREYRTKIFKMFKDVMGIRKVKGLEALSNGTPYMLETNHPEVMAMLYQNDLNEAVITIMNASGINYNNRFAPEQSRVELNYILIPATMALTAGMVFVNIADREKIEYVVKKFEDGFYRLVRKDGKKIVLDGSNTKFGTMFLKRFKHIPFRGNVANSQYHFVTNPYKTAEKHNLGKNLSITSI